jgi:tight adherence protein C
MTWLPLTGLAVFALGLGYLAWSVIAGPDPVRQRTLNNLVRGVGARPAAQSSRRTQQRRPLASTLATPATKSRLALLLTRAGQPAGWTVERLVSTKLLLVLGFGALTLLYWLNVRTLMALVIAVVVTVIAYFVPELRLYSSGIERRQQIGRELADTLDQMSIAVEAGLGFDAAMVRVARNGKGMLARELVRTMQDIQVGKPRRDAYTDLAERTDVPDLRRFTRSVIQAEAYGLALADVLHTQAAEMRTKRRQRAEEKAMQIPVKVVFPLILCILPVLFIVILGPAVINIAAALLK